MRTAESLRFDPSATNAPVSPEAGRPLRVALVSKADATGGGASRVAQALSQLLRASGHEAVHFAAGWKTPREDLRPLYGRRAAAWIRRLHEFTKRLGLPEVVPAELATLVAQGAHRFDVVHFHDLSSAISPLTVLAMSHLVPTAWTIHDCSPFTGGCLYPMGCERFRTGCGGCPQLGTWPLDTRRDFTRPLHGLKRLTASRGRVCYLTPSRWACEMALSSGLFNEPPRVIPNGVDVTVFHPMDRRALRRRFGVPLDRPVALLSAGNVFDERKGTRQALAALRRARGAPYFLVLVGSLDDGARAALDGFDYWATGYVRDNEQLAEVYALADVFVSSSLADNMPLAVLETMACGTPMVGFATGGIPEMISNDREGLLVPPLDIGALSLALERAARPENHLRWGAAARARVEREFGYDTFLQRHIALYRELARPIPTR